MKILGWIGLQATNAAPVSCGMSELLHNVVLGRFFTATRCLLTPCGASGRLLRLGRGGRRRQGAGKDQRREGRGGKRKKGGEERCHTVGHPPPPRKAVGLPA